MSGQLHALVPLPSFEEPWYQLVRRLDGPQDQSGWHGDKKNHAPTLTRTPNPWVSSMCKSLFQYSPVNFCWFLPAKLFLVSGTVGTYDQSFFHSKTIHVFGNTLSSLTRGGVGLFVKALQLLLRNFAQIYPHKHRSGKGACSSWTPCLLWQLFTLNGTDAGYTQNISQYRPEHHIRPQLILPLQNGYVTWIAYINVRGGFCY